MNDKESLCWKCDNTGGRCSWSKNFVPVKDWKAKTVTLKNGNEFMDTYFVIDCPCFKPFNTFKPYQISFYHYNLYKKYRNLFTKKEQELLDIYFKLKTAKLDMSLRIFQRKIAVLKTKLERFGVKDEH